MKLLLPILLLLISFNNTENLEKVNFLLFDVEINKIKANVSFIQAQNFSYGIQHYPDVLSFGVIPSKEIKRVRKYLSLNNLDERISKVYVLCKGEICKFLEIKDKEFFLLPKEKKEVEISLINDGKTEGSFEGYIYVTIIKPKNNIWNLLLNFV